MRKWTVTKLDASNSREFVSRGAPKHAVLRWEPRHYHLEWGEQVFDGPHMVILDGDKEYGVDLAVFFSTHRPVPARVDHYVKAVKIRATRLHEETLLETVVDGRVEVRATAPKGSWVIQNPSGEFYYNTPEEFQARYRSVEDD